MNKIEECYYFGCDGKPGHYLFHEGRHEVWNESKLPKDFPVRTMSLDGGLLPPNLPQDQGKATLVRLGGWTILTFWDRSVDTRGGCNSSFVIPAELDFEQAKEVAQERFPWVWERFKFEVILRD